jgi:hypothetical protein
MFPDGSPDVPCYRHLLQGVSKLDQDYFPEYLGQMYLINTPWIFRSVWAVIKPWLGERTQSKITLVGTDYRSILVLNRMNCARVVLVGSFSLPKSLN